MTTPRLHPSGPPERRIVSAFFAALPPGLLPPGLLLPALLLLGASAADAGEGGGPGASLTLYNQDFAVVREHIELDLSAGENEVSFSEVTSRLEPQSVMLRHPDGDGALRILEQNYRSDPVSPNLLLQHFEGREIDFEQNTRFGSSGIVRGRIVRAPGDPDGGAVRRYAGRSAVHRKAGGSAPIIEVDGKLRFSLPGTPLFPELGDDSIMKPTLHWLLAADTPVRDTLQLSYVSGGFTWSADYNLVVPETGDAGTFIGWVTMENRSGRTFADARIKLMAGDVNRVQPEERRPRRGVIGVAAEREQVEEREFDEYHLYTLPRRTTLRDRQTKQVEFVRGEEVRAAPTYIYNGSGMRRGFWHDNGFNRPREDAAFGKQSNEDVWVYRKIQNTEENGLGLPLPAGRVRFYREDTDGSLEFIGENEIDHTPRNETLRIYTGNAFDLVGERVRTDFQRDSSRRTIRESFEIKVRNRKENETVTITVVEPLYRWSNWEITEHSDTYRKIDSQTIEFLVRAEPGEEKKVAYTVKYTW